jgi:hypothetical protein
MDALVEEILEEIREKILNDEGTHEEQVLIDHIATLTEQLADANSSAILIRMTRRIELQKEQLAEAQEQIVIVKIVAEEAQAERDRLKVVISELQASNAGIRDEKLRIAELEAENADCKRDVREWKASCEQYDRAGKTLVATAERVESQLATAVEGLKKARHLCLLDAMSKRTILGVLRDTLSQIEQTPSAAIELYDEACGTQQMKPSAATDPAISAEASEKILTEEEGKVFMEQHRKLRGDEPEGE